MTRTEYLNQLEAYLMKLPQSDRIEAMDYFKELFDDAGPEGEEELMASLGSPKEQPSGFTNRNHRTSGCTYRDSSRDWSSHGYHRDFYRCG